MKKLYSFVATAFLLCAVPSLAADETVVSDPAVSVETTISAEMTPESPKNSDAMPEPTPMEKTIPRENRQEMRGEKQNFSEKNLEERNENFRSEMGEKSRGGRGEHFSSRDFDTQKNHGFWGAFWTGFLSLMVGAGAGIGGTVWFLRRKAMGK